MSKKIRLEKLTLIGFRKNYEVNFKTGLNYISGPMSTGKSSIAEMINYAFGSEKHKAYIEIGKSCKEVELDFWIGEDKFRIIRPLFEFTRPVKIFNWNEETGEFKKNFNLLEIDSPANENSLSAYLLKQIGLPKITVANQAFSFRDLFKYSYVKQSTIDSENLLMEKTSGSNLKRKPTFEIIFNIYNELLGELKQQLKEKINYIEFLLNKRLGVYEFLKEMNMLSQDTYLNEKNRLLTVLYEENQILEGLKVHGTYDESVTLNLESEIIILKDKITNIDMLIVDKEKYVDKLFLLRNQYSREMQKIDFIVEGAIILNSYDYSSCPSCLNPIRAKEGCNLCGSELEDLSNQEIAIFESENRRLNKKFNSLIAFIEQQTTRINERKNERKALLEELHIKQRELDHLKNHYLSPFFDQIQQSNYKIGKVNSSLDQLEKSTSVINQFSKITQNIIDEEALRDSLKLSIESIEKNNVSKTDLIQSLSELFFDILKDFSFPKLTDAYIKESNYLPYVRGVKYDELGSGGAVTMTTMAYFLAIALLLFENKNHLGLMIIDSPRKNLGADSEFEDDFKDEEIFNSIIKYFVSLKDTALVEDIQLIVINNGHPDFVDDNDIIVKFDGKGTRDLPYGLIDDIENL
ncbi:AAA family ATPase [Paenibacillus sp. FSL R7-0333]|uniref:AAA family ATPase n=1 Tax=Paenibacillus sp. FSL R7-0333 TaxID=1926587 RepID=UPI00096EDFD1|nr:hypothetical protein BK146_24595 [Paenibacillus sp. FSL R7-0333]